MGHGFHYQITIGLASRNQNTIFPLFGGTFELWGHPRSQVDVPSGKQPHNYGKIHHV